MTQNKPLDYDRRLRSSGSPDYSETAKEIAKHSNVSITLDGWPAAATCSVGIAGVVTIIVVKIVFG